VTVVTTALHSRIEGSVGQRRSGELRLGVTGET
jgi:hypothetical protein